MDEKQEFEMGLPNGVGEQMLAHAIEKFDVKLEHSEFGPKLLFYKSQIKSPIWQKLYFSNKRRINYQF